MVIVHLCYSQIYNRSQINVKYSYVLLETLIIVFSLLSQLLLQYHNPSFPRINLCLFHYVHNNI